MATAHAAGGEAPPAVRYETDPSHYRHLKLAFDGPVATLTLDIDENAGLRPGYALKLNSYDLGVDIELHDALQRIRFEHPEVGSVVITSGKPRIFCSGANIFMLGLSSHAWKVNFCKFTNETRNGIEDSSRHSGLRFLAACNGTTAGGGYELALACDEILLVDDRSSAVSLPEVPLLGVLPGTGGLTRITDKRRVRRDHADIFCTLVEGVRGEKARAWRLVDALAKPQQFAEATRQRALALCGGRGRAAEEAGVPLTPLNRQDSDSGYEYSAVRVVTDAAARTATITVRGPDSAGPADLPGIVAAGARWWPLRMARELDDAILTLRTNHLELGTWILKTEGSVETVLAVDTILEAHREHWFVRETLGMLRRTLARLEVTSRTLYALVERGSCFAGTLLELALAADRTYMQDFPDTPASAPSIAVSPLNFGTYPRVDGTDRLRARFYGEAPAVDAVSARTGASLPPSEAVALGLVTAAPDDIDWDDEIRLALEERASLSPDALTGMEANLRFGRTETMETRVFGRLTAWQNWIFNRPNAVGELGALKVYGSGTKARFAWERV